MNKLMVVIQVRIENVRDHEIEPIRKELLRAIYEDGNCTIIKKSSRSVTSEVISLKWEK